MKAGLNARETSGREKAIRPKLGSGTKSDVYAETGGVWAA
jgi:hypothetical protein